MFAAKLYGFSTKGSPPAFPSLNVTGDVTVGGNLTATGNLIGAIVRGLTALEFPANAGAPGVRCTTDTNSGIGRTAEDTMQTFVGGFSFASVIVGNLQTANDARLYSSGGYQGRESNMANITANTNNIALASNAEIARFTANAGPFNLTGMTGGAGGRRIVGINAGANMFNLTNEDAASTAANRFTIAAGGIALAPGAMFLASYDGTTNRWRVGLLT